MQNIKRKVILIIVSLVMIVSMIFGAINLSKIPFSTLKLTTGVNEFVLYSTQVSADNKTDNIDINKLIEQNKTKLGIVSVKNELKLASQSANALGDVYSFQQMYNGIEVYGRSIKVAVSQDGEVIFSGNFLKNISIKESKYFPIESALDIVKKQYNIENLTYQYIVYSLDYAPSFALKIDFADSYAVVDLKTLDIVSYVKGEKSATPTEAYDTKQTDVFDNQIDLTIERTKNKDVNDNYEYFLADSLRNIYIVDNKNDDKNYNINNYYSNNTGVFEDKTAVSALANFVKSYDFYANEKNTGKGRLGLRGDNNLIHDDSDSTGEQIIYVLVHYGNNYENAFYTKTANSKQYEIFAFGDGNPKGLHNLTASLDVAGHEYHHGLENNIAPLRYLNESGAISESVADIFGSLIQGYELTDEKFWLIGEDAVYNKRALRDMKDPSTLVYSNNKKYPEKMKDKIAYCNSAFCSHLTCDNGGVHGNSSILNKANYLMYSYAPNVFNKENMGKLWYSASSLFTLNVSFVQMYEILLTTARSLNLDDEAIEAIKKAYTEVGIANADSKLFKIYFSSNESVDSGKKPDNMFVEGGKTVTIPECTLVKNDSHFLFGWVDGYGVNDFSVIYKVGETLIMPNNDLTLQPLFLPKMWKGLEYKGIESLEGEGNRVSPYLIKSASDLAQVAYYYNTMPYFNKKYADYKNFRLENDIDLQGIPWMPIGYNDNRSAVGYFDGNYKKILNLNVSEESEFLYGGLFGCTSGSSTVKNLTIESGNVFSTYNAGGIAGVGSGTLSGLINRANIVSDISAGGIMGGSYLSSIKIENCINYGTVTSEKFAGGIVGELAVSGYEINDINIAPIAVSVSNCINAGSIKGNIAGGIAGSVVCANIVNNINIGTVTAVNRTNYLTEIIYAKAGGISGDINFYQEIYPYAMSQSNQVFTNSMVANNKSSAEIVSEKYSGALIGYAFNPKVSGKLYVNDNITNNEIIVGNKNEFTQQFSDMYVENNNSFSVDNLYTGSYDFDDKEYLTSTDNWYVSNYSNIYAVDIDWQVVQDGLPTIAKTEYWIDYASLNYAGGDGSKENPYLIADAEQLAKLSKDYSDKQLSDIYSESFAEKYKYYKVIADIDLQGKVWIAIGGDKNEDSVIGSGAYKFLGEFDGNNHTIANMFAREFVFDRTQLDKDNEKKVFTIHSSASLFSEMGSAYDNNNSIVKNVKLEKVNTQSTGLTAGICATAGIGSVIENCSVDGKINGNEAGGIVGKINYSAIIKNCVNKADVFAQVAGGIVGTSKSYNDAFVDAKIANCDNYGDVNIYNNNYLKYTVFGGGIIGEIDLAELEIVNCRSYGQINAINVSAKIGGIAGGVNRNNGTSISGLLKLKIKNCFSAYTYNEIGTSNIAFDALLGGINRIVENKGSVIILEDNYIKGENNKFDIAKYKEYNVDLSLSNNQETKENLYKHFYNIDGVETVILNVSKDSIMDIPSKIGCTKVAPYWEIRFDNDNCYFNAVYTINEYQIKFVLNKENATNVVISSYRLKHGERIVAPKYTDFSVNEKFSGWSGYYSYQTAQSDATYVGKVEFIKYNISFYYNGKHLYTEKMIQGDRIIFPNISQFVTNVSDYCWDNNTDIVEKNMNINLVKKTNTIDDSIVWGYIALAITTIVCILIIIIVVIVTKAKKKNKT